MGSGRERGTQCPGQREGQRLCEGVLSDFPRAGQASPPPSPQDAPGGPGGIAVRAAGEGGEGCCCHTPRVGTEGLAVCQNCPASRSLLHQTFLVELLRDKRKQNICREGAEGTERKVVLCSRVWSPSFAIHTYREVMMWERDSLTS